MSTVEKNPCLDCSEKQGCCSQLSGLRLSREEFEKHFRNHSEELSIVKDNKSFIVTCLNKSSCPHWEMNGCRIYNERPIDCRVYPYEIIQIKEKREVIEIKFRDSLSCPQTENLLMPIEEARALAMVLGQKIYGESKPIVIKYIQEEKKSSRFFVLFAPILNRLFKIISCIRKRGQNLS